MAPELIIGQPADATKLSDIYSLGAMLYELLVGTPPYGTMRTDRAGLLDYVKRVDETDPDPPSLAIRRGAEMSADELPSELDWIVMKAIERDPIRRYQNVAALHTDLQCFLDGRPVKAKAPSLVRESTRWWRRNRVPASTRPLSTSHAAHE